MLTGFRAVGEAEGILSCIDQSIPKGGFWAGTEKMNSCERLTEFCMALAQFAIEDGQCGRE